MASTTGDVVDSKEDVIIQEAASETSQSREEFLATFTPEEEKAIMRKVDKRFLFLIGMMLVIKNVSVATTILGELLTVSDRLQQRRTCESSSSWSTPQYHERAAYDTRPIQLGIIRIFRMYLAPFSDLIEWNDLIVIDLIHHL